MKLISLNAWGGKLNGPLIEFVTKNVETTDIFCFQEIYFSATPRPDVVWVEADLAAELQKALLGFSMFGRLADEKDLSADSSGADEDVRTGETIFVKNNLHVVEQGGFHTYVSDHESAEENIQPVTGNFLFVKIQSSQGDYLIGNIHGLWLPGSKDDTPKRIEQSRRLEEFLADRKEKAIICGDFNLAPKTESIRLLESGMRDLIKEYDIQTTRSRYYADMEKYKDYIADYAFASEDVQVLNFNVLSDEVSDHLPLAIEFH